LIALSTSRFVDSLGRTLKIARTLKKSPRLEMAVSREHSWKNKRKRSLYVEEGFAGFIFYRKNKISCPVIEEIPPIHEEERTDSQPTTLEPMEDEAADSEVSPLSDGQLESE
jgi:hypothetical protein